MREHHSQGKGLGRPRPIAVALLPAALLLTAVTSTAMAARWHPDRHRTSKVATCLLAEGRARDGCARASTRAFWNHWCRHEVSCAASHLYLRPHFGLRGPDGYKIKALPEGRWIRRFVRVGWAYHISPRTLMAIGLVESYGGTTSTAYMGCLRPGTYNSWPRQIKCAAKVLDAYGLDGYDPNNAGYPALIREHAQRILIRSR